MVRAHLHVINPIKDYFAKRKKDGRHHIFIRIECYNCQLKKIYLSDLFLCPEVFEKEMDKTLKSFKALSVFC